jgi:hypothetical protein
VQIIWDALTKLNALRNAMAHEVDPKVQPHIRNLVKDIPLLNAGVHYLEGEPRSTGQLREAIFWMAIQLTIFAQIALAAKKAIEVQTGVSAGVKTTEDEPEDYDEDAAYEASRYDA